MKKFLFAITIIATILTTATETKAITGTTYDPEQQLYPETAVVTEIVPGWVNDLKIIVVECANGNQFAFYNDDPEDFEIGDLVSMIMDSKGTELVFDDEVLYAKYAGFVKEEVR